MLLVTVSTLDRATAISKLKATNTGTLEVDTLKIVLSSSKQELFPLSLHSSWRTAYKGRRRISEHRLAGRRRIHDHGKSVLGLPLFTVFKDKRKTSSILCSGMAMKTTPN